MKNISFLTPSYIINKYPPKINSIQIQDRDFSGSSFSACPAEWLEFIPKAIV